MTDCRTNPEYASDMETVTRLNGIFVGLLSDDELAAFHRLVRAGFASHAYIGAAGFMGLAKVSCVPAPCVDDDHQFETVDNRATHPDLGTYGKQHKECKVCGAVAELTSDDFEDDL